MDPSTWAGTLTAAFTLVTAIVVFAGARATIKATRKVDMHVGTVDRKVDQVHEVVNSRLTAMLARTEAMVSLLEQHNLPVPPANDGTGGST